MTAFGKSFIYYEPGMTVPGESYSRGTTATYTDRNGIVRTAAINQKRDEHYIMGQRYLLLEGTKTNLVTNSEKFDLWTQDGVSTTTNAILAPDLTQTADFLVESATNAVHRTFVTLGQGAALQSFSIWAKAGTRSKIVVSMSDNVTGGPAIGVDLTNGQTFTPVGFGAGTWTNIKSFVEAYPNGWFRIFIYGAKVDTTLGLTGVLVNLYTTAASYLGDGVSGVYLWGGQFELGGPTSYIPTLFNAAATRLRDSYRFLTLPALEDTTFYMKHREVGTSVSPSANPRYFQFGANGTAPAIGIFANGGAAGALQSLWYNAGFILSGNVGAVAGLGDVQEIHHTINAQTGESRTINRLNGGAKSAAVASFFGGTPPSAYSSGIGYLNSDNGSASDGIIAIQSFKMLAGIIDIETAAGAGVAGVGGTGSAGFTGGWLLAERGHVAPPPPPKPRVRKPSAAELAAKERERQIAARQKELSSAEAARIARAQKLWGNDSPEPDTIRLPNAMPRDRGPKIVKLPKRR